MDRWRELARSRRWCAWMRRDRRCRPECPTPKCFLTRPPGMLKWVRQRVSVGAGSMDRIPWTWPHPDEPCRTRSPRSANCARRADRSPAGWPKLAARAASSEGRGVRATLWRLHDAVIHRERESPDMQPAGLYGHMTRTSRPKSFHDVPGVLKSSLVELVVRRRMFAAPMGGATSMQRRQRGHTL